MAEHGRRVQAALRRPQAGQPDAVPMRWSRPRLQVCSGGGAGRWQARQRGGSGRGFMCAYRSGGRSSRAQTMRSPSLVVSVPQLSGPVRAPMMSSPWGRSSAGLQCHSPAEVFAFDPQVGGVGLDPDGEELACAGGVGDGVGSEFAGDQDGIAGGGAAVHVRGDLAADPGDLVGPAVEGALVPGGLPGRRRAHVIVVSGAGRERTGRAVRRGPGRAGTRGRRVSSLAVRDLPGGAGGVVELGAEALPCLRAGWFHRSSSGSRLVVNRVRQARVKVCAAGGCVHRVCARRETGLALARACHTGVR